MKFIEADGHGLAHIDVGAPGQPLSAACGKNPFPWDWYQPVKRQKPLCRGCVARVRR